MKTIKYTLALVALLAATLLPASAQLGTPSTLITSGVNEAYAGITNNTSCAFTNAIIDLRGKTSVALGVKAALDAAGTTANTITVQQSIDRVNWTGMMTFTQTPAGTTPVITVTNLSVGGVPYIRVSAIANANANTGAITNYTVKYSAK